MKKNTLDVIAVTAAMISFAIATVFIIIYIKLLIFPA